MSRMEEWLNYLKRKKEHIRSFLEEECQIDTRKILEEQSKTPFSEKLQAKCLKELRVACIMDRFTLDSYAPECNLLQLTPANWKGEIDQFRPELIFIESAWQGKDGLWYRKIANGSTELYQMTSYCREQDIPIVFWNKEDPIYTDTFMPAARCADYIFTTDIDCVIKYKESLGHNNVFFLHFAAQPQTHNPIEKYERQDKFCFAGAYYHRYPERAKTFDNFSEVFMGSKGLDIYDRNYNNPKPEFQFPEKYKDSILGCLDPSEIDVAYKGYNYGINMNSVEQSQTMFARRVFEMLASNTVTVGNYSRGVKNFFGDLTICTNDALTLKNNLEQTCGTIEMYRKYRLLGLRSVLQNHLYEDRLNYIAKKVFGRELKRKLPVITLFCCPVEKDFERSIEMFQRQTYPHKKLYILGEYEKPEDDNIFVLPIKQWSSRKIAECISDGYVGVWNAEHYYGKNYLLDLALTFRYLMPDGVGKGKYYSFNGQDIVISGDEKTYKKISVLKADRAVWSMSLCGNYRISEFLKQDFIPGDNLFSIDEFNFCENFKNQSCATVDDLCVQDQGVLLEKIELTAERIKPNRWNEDVYALNKEKIKEYLPIVSIAKIVNSETAQGISFVSQMEEKATQYIYLNKYFEINEFKKGEKLNFQFSGNGNMDILGVCVFYDSKKNKISPVFAKMNIFSSNQIPENAVYFKFGLRIVGSGNYELKSILLGLEHNTEELSCFLSRSNVLILSNQYPSPEALYRNMFVHKRVMAYKQEGLLCDVMRMNIFCQNRFSEFEGINVIEGQAERLGNILETGYIDTVCVHFLDRSMWEVLKLFGSKIRIFVWLHGAEIQPWWRREYNYTNKSELEKAKKESEERQLFWKEVFSEIDKYNIHFIFVSKYFADEIFEDNKIQLPSNKYSIIHNCIDTEMFNYIKKDSEQRKNLLSIRPYASNKYANDLTVKCIMELAKEPFFEELQFRIMGNGEHFDRITAPLKKYSNVILEKRFLRQDEIASLHKHYGIFITPTRMDAQGVSRDEAMSSGLVPITNAVTAIPEFVDETCGILAPGEDYLQMAEGIKKLYYDADLFEQMSENAARRVRQQTAKEFTICKEIALIQG